MIGIFQVERRNTGYIGRYAHMIIRYTYSRPDTANLIRSFSKDFEVPYFVMAGELKVKAPYGKIVNNKYAEEAIK